MKPYSILSLIVSLIALASLGMRAQGLEEKINTIVAPYTGNNKPGCAIAVLKNGEVILAKGYGLSNLEHRLAFTPSTVSDIGSIAKQITCFAILLLNEDGKLDLDDPIAEYFDNLPSFGNEITIRHLMTHTSGLREIYGHRAVAGGRSGDGILQEDALRLVQYSEELNFAPGTKYNYCNTAYMLLADIIAAVSGMPFEDFLQAHIFKPLEMNNTYVMDEQGEWFPDNADSYQTMPDGHFRKIFDNSTVQGAGGIYTSLNDLILWLKNYQHTKVGSSSIINQMRTPAYLKDGTEITYGLGLQVSDMHGLKNFRHSGSSAGYRAYLVYFDQDSLGILVKTNQGEIPIRQVVDTILQTLTEAKIVRDNSTANSETTTPAFISDANLEKYTGRYFSKEAEMSYQIILKDNGLIASSLRNGEIPLTRSNQYLFTGDQWYFRNIRFEMTQGKVAGFRLGNGRVDNLWFKKVEY